MAGSTAVVHLLTISMFCAVFKAACLQEIIPEPLLLNPSFEDHCINGTGFFFFYGDHTSSVLPSIDGELTDMSSSDPTTFLKWNATGSGIQVVSGREFGADASDGNCCVDTSFHHVSLTGGMSQTLTTAPNASYIIRFDMMIYTTTCFDASPGTVSLKVSAGGQNATVFSSSENEPWSQRTYQFQASTHQTELTIWTTSCGILVDNVRAESIVQPLTNVLANGGFETAPGVPQDPGSSGFQLVPDQSQQLSSWTVTGKGITCYASSAFPATEGQRVVWLALLLGEYLFQYPGGLEQVMATQVNVTYHISFDVACHCLFNSSAGHYCPLQVAVGSEILNFNISAQNHTVQNPGWLQKVVEFTAISSRTVVRFQYILPDEALLYDYDKMQCPPYLDNVVVNIPAQKALLKLKKGFGTALNGLQSWNEVSKPCLTPAGTWIGVTCLGLEVIGLTLSAHNISNLPFDLLALPGLQWLNLSYNSLSGSVPSFLGSMPNLVALDLSHNSFQGQIPSVLGSLLLQELNLQDNELSGAIPDTLALASLRVLSLENNNLSGSVPQGVSLLRESGTSLSFIPGNNYLCSDNNKDDLTSCHPAPTTSSKNNLPGALGGSAAGILITGIVLLLFLKRQRSRRSKSHQKIDLNLDTCQAFSFQELEEATGGFAIELGKGGYGTVYKAALKNGRAAAVKRLNQVSRQGPDECIREVELLSRLHHANIVSLLGYCIEYREHLLVYEFMPKGSLSHVLHRAFLGWEERMKIAVHIAFGIEYLHYFASPGLVHRDVKSANILLDDDNNAKVADFGLCKEAPLGAEEPQTTAIKGSFGYLDPAYLKTNRLSSKSDVYSYGVILLELVTGRRAVTEGELLTDWCKQFYDLDVSLMVDPRLARNFIERELITIVGVARDCVIEEQNMRSNMRAVVCRLCEGLPSYCTIQPCEIDNNTAWPAIEKSYEEAGEDSWVLDPR